MTYDEWQEKRKFKRYDSDLTVRFSDMNNGAKLHEGAVENVSRGGVFISTKDVMPVGTMLKMIILAVDPFGEARKFEAEGRVQWTSTRPGEEGMGTSFTRIERHSQYALLACAYRGQG